jgi:hypothetical protein
LETYVDLTIKSYDTATSSFDVTELEEHFTVDSSGYSSDTLTYDNNGNLLYDGTQAYSYDAWNRLATVRHAYRDASGTLHTGQVFEVIGYFDPVSHLPVAAGYDAAGRRIMKAINGTGAMDCTYNYYLDDRCNTTIGSQPLQFGLATKSLARHLNETAGGSLGFTHSFHSKVRKEYALGLIRYSVLKQRCVGTFELAGDVACLIPINFHAARRRAGRPSRSLMTMRTVSIR